MKIYALRDRLIDYFMEPFAALEQNQVLASLANVINTENPSAVHQAPHHFELWQLGAVTTEGHIEAHKEFICDCSSLIRAGVRTGEERKPGTHAPEGPQILRRGPQGDDREGAATYPAPMANTAQATPSAAQQAHPRSG